MGCGEVQVWPAVGVGDAEGLFPGLAEGGGVPVAGEGRVSTEEVGLAFDLNTLGNEGGGGRGKEVPVLAGDGAVAGVAAVYGGRGQAALGPGGAFLDEVLDGPEVPGCGVKL